MTTGATNNSTDHGSAGETESMVRNSADETIVESNNVNGEGNVAVVMGDMSGPAKPPISFNVNSYATHKTLTAGAMDVALLSSNVNQVRMMAGSEMTTFQIITLTMLGISIILQFIVVLLIIMMGSSHVDITSRDKEAEKAKRRLDIQNKATLGMVAFISLINIMAGQVNDPTPALRDVGEDASDAIVESD